MRYRSPSATAVVFGVFALFIAGCAVQSTSETSAFGQRELGQSEKKVIAEAVGKVIRDPGSAKYRWAKFPVNAGTGDVNYCASVDAKSPLPGYGGRQLYVAVVGTEGGQVRSAVVGAIHGGNDAHVVRTVCKRYGLNPEDAT